jgi:hypothetical protein
MAGKRGDKSSFDVLSDIREELNKTDKMTDEIENLLKGIG